MTFGARPIQDAVSTAIAAGASLSPLELLQVVETSNAIDASTYCVANIASLPSATCNKGRLIFVEDKQSYRYSDGVSWTNDFTTTLNTVAYAWGCNLTGQLGNDTTTETNSPVSTVGRFTDWRQVSVGQCHVAGVRQNGTLWTWGSGFLGRLGDNTTSNRSSPVSVVGGFTDWCQVSAGSSATLAVRQNGTLWSWGAGITIGEGQSFLTSRSSPVSVAGGFTDWCQVSVGSNHAAAVRQNGTLWAWGSNSSGRLGDNTTVDKSSPVSVVGSFTDWCQVSAGSASTVAVRQNGTLWAWGSNGSGELGDGTIVAKSSPVSVVGGFTDWCQASTNNSTAAVRQNGTIWTWGASSSGRLGDNTVVNKSSPVSVVGGFTDWCQISVGNEHSVAVRQNGSLWAWGRNYFGKLGDGTQLNRSSPVSVVGGFTDWAQASAGGTSSAGVRGDVKGF